MLIAITNLKGGVAKTTTAVHVAYMLSRFAKTLLVDGDDNRSALTWTGQQGSPFQSKDLKILTYQRLAASKETFEHVVIDTKGRPSREDLSDISQDSNLIIVPTPPNGDDLRVSIECCNLLSSFGSKCHRVLLTKVPNTRKPVGSNMTALEADARAFLEEHDIPIFKTSIRYYDAPYRTAYNDGVPVGTISKEAGKDYSSLIKEVEALTGGKILDGLAKG